MAQSMSPAQQQMAAQQQNLAIRNLIVRGGNGFPPAVNMWQALNPSVPANAGPGTVITTQLRNVGLVKRLLVKVTATVTAGASSTQTLTSSLSPAGQGLSNLVSNFTFTDLANNQRINTSGWHVTMLSSVKRRRVFGAAYTNDTPFGYGNNYNRTQFAQSTITATNNAPIVAFFEIPFAYSDHDLRGAVFADVTQATMQLQMTLNPGMFVASTADATLAMYKSAGADLATLSNVTVQVYQNFLDQLPTNNNVPLLPALDLGTAYVLNNTSSPLPVANQDNAIPFVNARQFQSIAFIYDNAGVINIGTDINSIAIVSANFTNIQKLDPITQALFSRNILQDDPPAGMYYLDFRDRPIDTNQYGNMQLIINPSSVGGSTATFLLAWEAFGIIGLVNQGGAIPSGA